MRRIRLTTALSLFCVATSAGTSAAQPATLLYRQDFENPNGFVNDGGDINIFRTVNELYSNQPPGFVFSQNFTVETLQIGGTAAFGVGYSDPQGRAGSYALGLLSATQDDVLGLAFNVGGFRFLNFGLDISSIDLDRFGGPFVPAGGSAPLFLFSLYDNPSGAPGLGSGTPLASANARGTIAPNRFTFDWTNVIVALDATGNTNGNVILRVDLLEGGYAAMDNFVVAASDNAGQLPGTVVPEPQSWLLMLTGLGLLGFVARRRAA